MSGNKTQSIMTSNGIVENFGEKLWSFDDREKMLKLLIKCGMNMWIYGPKMDPYCNKKWSEPYPEDVAKQIGGFIKTCDTNKVNFGYALTPSKKFDYGNKQHWQQLVQKMSSLARLGCKHLCFIMTNVDTELTDETQKEFPKIEDAEVQLLNWALTQFDKDVTLNSSAMNYYVLPHHSWGTILNDKNLPPHLVAYWKRMSTLHPRYTLLWNGPSATLAKTIQVDYCKKLATFFGKRRVMLWDNYPVNENRPSVMNLGPLLGREVGIEKHLSGMLFNPMPHLAMSQITLRTCFDFVRDPKSYFPLRSLTQALRYILESESHADDMIKLIRASPESVMQAGVEWAPPSLIKVNTADYYEDLINTAESVREHVSKNLPQYQSEFEQFLDIVSTWSKLNLMESALQKVLQGPSTAASNMKQKYPHLEADMTSSLRKLQRALEPCPSLSKLRATQEDLLKSFCT